MSEKYFVLDTNVILHDPHCLNAFDEHSVIIPLKVFEELDKFKTYNDMKGVNARMFIRTVEPMLDNAEFYTDETSEVAFYMTKFINKFTDVPCYIISTDYFAESLSNDNIILTDVVKFKEICMTDKNEADFEVTLVSKDINLRIKAKQFGIKSEDYENTKLSKTPKMNGNFLYASDMFINEMHNEKAIYCQCKTLNEFLVRNSIRWHDTGEPPDIKHNDYFLVKSELNPSRSLLMKYKNETFIKVNGVTSSENEGVMDILPKNYKQAFLLDALLDDDIHIIFAIGEAGSGKTLLSIAAGLVHTIEMKHFDSILIARPLVPNGKDIGALPGGLEEKIDPYMQPIYDNFNYIFRNSSNAKNYFKTLFEQESINILALPYIRGRSLHSSFIIIDEAQNMTVSEMKTVLTRIGDNSKVVFTGDISQIDNPYLDERDNGLSVVSQKFKNHNSRLATTIFLDKCARGIVASETLECLD